MTFWIWFWTVFLFASLALFAGLAVVVSVGGFSDILSLFRTIEKQEDNDSS